MEKKSFSMTLLQMTLMDTCVLPFAVFCVVLGLKETRVDLTALTWVRSGGASSAVEGRSLEGVDNVAVSYCCQVIVIWEGAVEPRGVQLGQDDLSRGKTACDILPPHREHLQKGLSRDSGEGNSWYFWSNWFILFWCSVLRNPLTLLKTHV